MAGFGETLYQARANMGVTLKEAEQATRINRHHLDALESENFSALPPLIYQRGIVRNYASYLRLDPGKLLVMFEETQGPSGKAQPNSVASIPPVNMPSHWTPNFAIIAFTVVLSAIVFAWVYSAFVAQPENTLAPTELAPTATPFDSDIPVPTKQPTQPAPTPTATAEPTATTTAADNTGSRTDTNDDTQEGDSGDNGAIEQRGGDNVRNSDSTGEEATQDEDTATQEPTSEPTVESQFDESELTSISVEASSTIWVTVWADDVVVFDGNLDAGEATGHVPGNQFRVYTSSGANTVFTNACGDEFLMGDESGQANYLLSKQPDSCAPIRE
jgi:cytoskeletal protein RodZ